MFFLCAGLIERLWRELTKFDTMRFRPKRLEDLLLWCDVEGVEDQRMLRKSKSWERLQSQANRDFTSKLPQLLSKDPEFGLMFFVVYPHRISPAIIGFIDRRWKLEASVA